MNDCKVFKNTFKEIHPVVLELKKQNANDNVATFLALNIRTKKGQFSTKLYDKKDGFNFSIVRLRYKYSNIPSKMFYSSSSAGILEFEEQYLPTIILFQMFIDAKVV